MRLDYPSRRENSKRKALIRAITKMNDTDLDRFRTRILTRLEQLEHEDALGKDGQAVVQLDQQSVGRLSRMDALQMQAMARAQQARRDLESRRLRAALDRMEQDEFGYCAECGEEIAPRRLDLDPAAVTCISCASG